jgi:hypothetical protein
VDKQLGEDRDLEGEDEAHRPFQAPYVRAQ